MPTAEIIWKLRIVPSDQHGKYWRSYNIHKHAFAYILEPEIWDYSIQALKVSWWYTYKMLRNSNSNLSYSNLGRGYRLKSGIFGHTAKFGQPPCLFHSSAIGIKNKLTKQTVKILMRRLIRSRLIWISTVCKWLSEFTWCPNLPDFTLYDGSALRPRLMAKHLINKVKDKI